jgi:hypothetical protein
MVIGAMHGTTPGPIRPETARICGTASLLGAPGQWGSRSGRGQCGTRRHHRHPERARGPGQRHEKEATAHARRPAPCRPKSPDRSRSESRRARSRRGNLELRSRSSTFGHGLCAGDTFLLILPYPGRHCDCVSLPAAQFGSICTVLGEFFCF